MTKKELADFFGLSAVTDINKAFVKAEEECESLRIKKGHYNKNTTIDYTLEETLIAIKYMTRKVCVTPIMVRLLKENFIHRDKPAVVKSKKIKIPYEAQNFLYRKRALNFDENCCCNCVYLTGRVPVGTVQKPQPYCTFHGYLLNKKLPKINIYGEMCPFHQKDRRRALIFTSAGLISDRDIDYKGAINLHSSRTMGINQSEFKSKRKRNEPIVILRDAFADF